MNEVGQSIVEKIKANTNIAQYIGKYVTLTAKTSTRSLGLCPFHPEKTPSFTVCQIKQFFYCFGCHAKGDVIKFAQMINNQTFIQVIEQFAHSLGLDLKKQNEHGFYFKLQQALSLFIEKAHLNLNQTAIDYLISRGINEDSFANYKLGWVDQSVLNSLEQNFERTLLTQLGITNQIRERILFPIFNNSKAVGFGARSLDDKGAKYINSPQNLLFSKKELLYGQSYLSERKTHTLLVEGYIDAILVNQSTNYQAYACLGTAVSEQQLSTMIEKKVILCFDGDNAGRKACWKALELCFKLQKPGYIIQVAIMPEGYDPASLILTDSKHFAHIIDTAQDLSEYVFEQVMKGEKDSAESLLVKQKELQKWFNKISDKNVKEIIKIYWKKKLQSFYSKPLIKNKPKLDVHVDSSRKIQFQLLSILMQNTTLIDDVEEELSNIRFDPDLQILQDNLLNRSIVDSKLAQYCLNIKTNTSLEYWRLLSANLLKAQYIQELEKLKQELAANFTTQIWQKICTLQTLLAQVKL